MELFDVLVFNQTIAPYTELEVKKRLVETLGLTAVQTDQLFLHTKTLFKSRVDERDAIRYQKVLSYCGIQSELSHVNLSAIEKQALKVKALSNKQDSKLSP